MADRPHKLSCSTTTALVRQTTVMPTVTLTEQAKSAAATEQTSKLLHREKKRLYGVWPTRTDLRLFQLLTFQFFSLMVYSFIYFWAALTSTITPFIYLLDTCLVMTRERTIINFTNIFTDICNFLLIKYRCYNTGATKYMASSGGSPRNISITIIKQETRMFTDKWLVYYIIYIIYQFVLFFK